MMDKRLIQNLCGLNSVQVRQVEYALHISSGDHKLSWLYSRSLELLELLADLIMTELNSMDEDLEYWETLSTSPKMELDLLHLHVSSYRFMRSRWNKRYPNWAWAEPRIHGNAASSGAITKKMRGIMRQSMLAGEEQAVAHRAMAAAVANAGPSSPVRNGLSMTEIEDSELLHIQDVFGNIDEHIFVLRFDRQKLYCMLASAKEASEHMKRIYNEVAVTSQRTVASRTRNTGLPTMGPLMADQLNQFASQNISHCLRDLNSVLRIYATSDNADDMHFGNTSWGVSFNDRAQNALQNLYSEFGLGLVCDDPPVSTDKFYQQQMGAERNTKADETDEDDHFVLNCDNASGNGSATSNQGRMARDQVVRSLRTIHDDIRSQLKICSRVRGGYPLQVAEPSGRRPSRWERLWLRDALLGLVAIYGLRKIFILHQSGWLGENIHRFRQSVAENIQEHCIQPLRALSIYFSHRIMRDDEVIISRRQLRDSRKDMGFMLDTTLNNIWERKGFFYNFLYKDKFYTEEEFQRRLEVARARPRDYKVDVNDGHNSTWLGASLNFAANIATRIAGRVAPEEPPAPAPVVEKPLSMTDGYIKKVSEYYNEMYETYIPNRPEFLPEMPAIELPDYIKSKLPVGDLQTPEVSPEPVENIPREVLPENIIDTKAQDHEQRKNGKSKNLGRAPLKRQIMEPQEPETQELIQPDVAVGKEEGAPVEAFHFMGRRLTEKSPGHHNMKGKAVNSVLVESREFPGNYVNNILEVDNLSDDYFETAMEYIMHAHKEDLHHPVYNTLTGGISNQLAIQVQNMKIMTEAAMLRLDQIMAANQLTMAGTAAIPAFVLMFGVTMLSTRFFRLTPPNTAAKTAKLRLLMTQVERSLQEMYQPLPGKSNSVVQAPQLSGGSRFPNVGSSASIATGDTLSPRQVRERHVSISADLGGAGGNPMPPFHLPEETGAATNHTRKPMAPETSPTTTVRAQRHLDAAFAVAGFDDPELHKPVPMQRVNSGMSTTGWTADTFLYVENVRLISRGRLVASLLKLRRELIYSFTPRFLRWMTYAYDAIFAESTPSVPLLHPNTAWMRLPFRLFNRIVFGYPGKSPGETEYEALLHDVQKLEAPEDEVPGIDKLLTVQSMRSSYRCFSMN